MKYLVGIGAFFAFAGTVCSVITSCICASRGDVNAALHLQSHVFLNCALVAVQCMLAAFLRREEGK